MNVLMSSTCEFLVTTLTSHRPPRTNPQSSRSNECDPRSGLDPLFVVHSVRSKSINTTCASVHSTVATTSSPSPHTTPHSSQLHRSHAMHRNECGQNAALGHLLLTGHSRRERMPSSHLKQHRPFPIHSVPNCPPHRTHSVLPVTYMRGVRGGHSPSTAASIFRRSL